jgi:hypothetical protein
VAPLCSIGYLIGESFGWGEWVGNLTDTRYNQTNQLEGEGKSNGIYFLSTHIVPNWSVAYIKYCRVALGLRGLYWWGLTLLPLLLLGVNAYAVIVAIFVLAIGFPLACELGYLSSSHFSFKMFNFNVAGGWEHQEIWYGLIQDLTLLALVLNMF